MMQPDTGTPVAEAACREADRIESVDMLESMLAEPSDALKRDLAELEGDILVLGCSGKVGPTLCRLARNAAPDKRIIGVARFSDETVRQRMDGWGVETLPCDLFDAEQVAALPRVKNVVYMIGRKFGTSADPELTWAMNVHIPGIVAQAFRDSRIVVFSTLCVYPWAAAPGAGCDESVPPKPPSGEYANSCVGRERMFRYFSKRYGTPGRIVRLNYAIDMRYGILLEIGRKVLRGEPIDLSMGHVNIVWQGDASEHILRCLGHCTSPSSPINVGSTENTSIRSLADAFGARFRKEPIFSAPESDRSWINDCSEAARLFGAPRTAVDRMIDWVADWIERGQPTYAKPTKYERRDGEF